MAELSAADLYKPATDLTSIKPMPTGLTVVDPPAPERGGGDIWLPQNHNVAMGICVQSTVDEIKAGDVVYYHKDHGHEIKGVTVIAAGCVIAVESMT